jgi:hypothetical protein
MKSVSIEMVLVVLLSFFIVVTSAAAAAIDYTYDASGRLIRADYGDKSIIYIYDKAGNLLRRKIGNSCGYVLSRSILAYGSTGGSGSFNVTVVGSGCSWNALANDSWINVTLGSGSGNEKVDYTVSNNDTGQTRQGTITVEDQTFAVKQAKSEFGDIPSDYWAYSYVYSIYAGDITAGCGGGNYCPDAEVSRMQMAVFLLKALGQQPAASCAGLFNDVNAQTGGNEVFCRYVEKFSTLGITAGCGNNNFCPSAPVSRMQMAVFITKALGETPSENCIGIFNDVDDTTGGNVAFCKYIEKFATLDITSGCGNGNYCPDQPVTRAQMAVFLTKGFLQ